VTWLGNTPFEELGMTEQLVVLLKELAEDSDYWRKASSFFHQVMGRKLSSLSSAQQDWLSSIVASLEVELNRRTAIDLFEQGV